MFLLCINIFTFIPNFLAHKSKSAQGPWKSNIALLRGDLTSSFCHSAAQIAGHKASEKDGIIISSVKEERL